MPTEFKLPDLGEGIHEAEILAVKVKEGETVKEDQPIFEVETDKAVVEIPSPFAGVVEKIHVNVGDIVTVGSVLISFTVGSAASKPKAAAAATKKESAAVVDQPVQPLQTTVAAGRNGGTVHEQGRPVAATPATRRMAREIGVDLRRVRGSGPAGRVMKEDVRAYAEGVAASSLGPVPSSLSAAYAPSAPSAIPGGGQEERASLAPLTVAPFEMPDFSKQGPIERVPLKSIRRKIAMNMTQSWSHIPHVTHFDEADITQVDWFRQRYEQEMQARGGRLTLTVFMLKAVVSGLKRYPQFNASLDEKNGEIIYKHYYNIGIAVATERGLIVPVIKDVDKKSLTDLSIELGEIAAKTREGKIELDRLQGGTFTITNIGAISGTGMVPMINYPEAAILGMARGAHKPIVVQGKIEVRLILPLALSFDHRIADGAEAAYFVRHVASFMEEPMQLLLEV